MRTLWGELADQQRDAVSRGCGDAGVAQKLAQQLANRYSLLEPIARGGMAVVWRARDERLGRAVAVKILHPRLATDENFRERFRREAVAAASFNHPNIITVFDTGADGDSHYIVMELIEGPSLSRLLGPQGTLTPTECVSMMRAVLSALNYSHERGVIHRDIKPANIMLSARAAPGSIKVGDFGIARAMSGSDLTATGAIIGTASYLAPEQASGHPVDHRADLYSLGCVAYRCLTGRLPWEADNELGVAMARTMRPPDPLTPQVPDAPRKLVHVIEAALARDPAARYQSAAAMAEAVAPLRGAAIRLDRSKVAPPPSTRQRAETSPNSVSDPGSGHSTDQPAAAPNGHAQSGITADGRTPIPSPALEIDSPAKRAHQQPQPSSSAPVRHKRRKPSDKPDERRRGTSQPHATRNKNTNRTAGGTQTKKSRAHSRARAAAHARRMQRARRTTVVIAVCAIVLAIILIGLFSSGTGDSTATTTTAGSAATMPVREAFPFDPEGDRAENTLDVDEAINADTESGWRTEAYKTRDFGNLKSGVGIGFDLGSIREPNGMEVTISSGSNFEVYTSNSAPSELDEWTLLPGSKRTNVGNTGDSDLTTVTIDTDGAEARYWLVWITRLSPQTTKGLFYTEVAEVTFGG